MKLSIFTFFLLSSFYTQTIQLKPGQSFQSDRDGKDWTIAKSEKCPHGITHQTCVPSTGPKKVPFIIQAIALAGCCPRRANKFIEMYKHTPEHAAFDQREKTIYSFFPHLEKPNDQDPE